jgi:quinol monooxygenase YgiN
MITLTAIIRCTPGSEPQLRDALLDVARYASAHEPGTVGYFVSGPSTEGVFVTHERYADQAALDAHNAGPGATAFFERAKPFLAEVEVHVGSEIFPD